MKSMADNDIFPAHTTDRSPHGFSRGLFRRNRNWKDATGVKKQCLDSMVSVPLERS